eukprot:898566-Amphidinium_carterae.1
MQAIATALLLPKDTHGGILRRRTGRRPQGGFVMPKQKPVGRRGGLPGFLGQELPAIARP